MASDTDKPINPLVNAIVADFFVTQALEGRIDVIRNSIKAYKWNVRDNLKKLEEEDPETYNDLVSDVDVLKKWLAEV